MTQSSDHPTGYRVEHDTMGEVLVPVSAKYRAQTQRAVDNFAISSARLSPPHIAALGQIKRAAALANQELGVIAAPVAEAIVAAATEVTRVCGTTSSRSTSSRPARARRPT